MTSWIARGRKAKDLGENRASNTGSSSSNRSSYTTRSWKGAGPGVVRKAWSLRLEKVLASGEAGRRGTRRLEVGDETVAEAEAGVDDGHATKRKEGGERGGRDGGARRSCARSHDLLLPWKTPTSALSDVGAAHLLLSWSTTGTPASPGSLAPPSRMAADAGAVHLLLPSPRCSRHHLLVPSPTRARPAPPPIDAAACLAAAIFSVGDLGERQIGPSSMRGEADQAAGETGRGRSRGDFLGVYGMGLEEEGNRGEGSASATKKGR